MPLMLLCAVSYTLNLWIVLENKMSEHVSPFRRWSWVPLLSLITWLSSAPPHSIQSSCRPSLVLRGAESSLLSSPPVSGQITVSVVCVSVATHFTMYWIQPWFIKSWMLWLFSKPFWRILNWKQYKDNIFNELLYFLKTNAYSECDTNNMFKTC